MKRLRLDRLFLSLLAALVIGAVPALAAASSSDVPWQTGIRAVGNGATIEPAVNDVTGTQTFLITPNHSPFWDASQHPPGTPVPANLLKTSAPLYLVTYPMASTVDATAPLNCYTEGAFDPTGKLPYNCDHAQIPGVKGHDHLVGVPGTQSAGGDFNVAWHVLATFFTPQGMHDGAMNTRILTLKQLTAAQAAGDVTGFVDTGIYFDCSVVSSPVYLNGTPLHFPPFPS
ncbi:MAG TPA: hypothetical protein VI408_05345 [Gaiellaceae bacterium]